MWMPTKSGSSYSSPGGSYPSPSVSLADSNVLLTQRGDNIEISVLSWSNGLRSYDICDVRFDFEEKYTPLRPIARGSYGFVCAALNEETGETLAVKKVHNVFDNVFEARRALREIRLLRFCKHENIVGLKDFCITEPKGSFNSVYIITELMETDLHGLINSDVGATLGDDHRKYFVYQILRALKYLHSAQIVHRDLKPGNLLVNSQCDLVICDFGMARNMYSLSGDAEAMTEYVVSRWYRAPEVLLARPKYDEKIDVWSVGCILAELLLRKPIFPGRNLVEQIDLIFALLGTPSEEQLGHVCSTEAFQFLKSRASKVHASTSGASSNKGQSTFEERFPNVDADALDLLKKMLCFDPQSRISVTEALGHPYLSIYHDEADEPVAGTLFDFVDFDLSTLTVSALREALYAEMTEFKAECSMCDESSEDDLFEQHLAMNDDDDECHS